MITPMSAPIHHSAGSLEFAGRVLPASLFLIAGLGKIGASYAAISSYMSSFGVPGALLPAVIATGVLGGIALILGWKTRIMAFLLACHTWLAALIFHRHFSDELEWIQFLKDVSVAGGLRILVAYGAGPLSFDRRFA